MTKLQEKFNTTSVLGKSKSNHLSLEDEKLIIFHQLMKKHKFNYSCNVQKGLARKWANELI